MVLRSVLDPGCLIQIPDPTFFHPGSRIRIKEFKYFNPKKWFLRFRKYYPGCSSQIRIPDPDPDFLPIQDPGVKKVPDPGSGSTTLVLRQIYLVFHQDAAAVLLRVRGPAPDHRLLHDHPGVLPQPQAVRKPLPLGRQLRGHPANRQDILSSSTVFKKKRSNY